MPTFRFSPIVLGSTIAVALTMLAAPAGASASELRETAIVKAVARVKGSVVNLRGEKTVSNEANQRALGLAESGRRISGMGSGVVIDPRGYVLTNFHVVDGVRRIRATLADGKTHTAKLIAHDDVADLAIVKISSAPDLPVIDIGVSSDLMLAEKVIAVGNPFGYEHTVTQGIISALRRTVQVTDTLVYENLIQTDASINPGNSGGPLLNVDGNVIGIVVAVRAGAQGIAFAIPIDRAMESAARMLSEYAGSALWHGMQLEDDTSDPQKLTLWIRQVEAGSPAERAGLKRDDLIVEFGGTLTRRRLDIERQLLGRLPGEKIAVSIRRDGGRKSLEIALDSAGEDRDDSTWTVLGLQMTPVPDDAFRQYGTHYRGGMRVERVRTGSPAHAQGIRRGDVLLGIHVWETVTQENVLYILNRPDLAKNPLKFYIYRDQETLYGQLDLSSTVR